MTFRSKSLGGPTSIFNANIFNAKAEKIWFGDLELGRDHDRIALIELSKAEGPIYILYEFDGRFLREYPTPDYVRAVAAVTVTDGTFQFSEGQKERMKVLELRKKRQLKDRKNQK